MKREEPPEEVTITGYVTATDWDWNDTVSAVSIEAYNEEYVVEADRLGEELFDELGSEVEVTGFVREETDGTKRIKLTSYEVLSKANSGEDEHDEYDDYGEGFGSEQGENPM